LIYIGTGKQYPRGALVNNPQITVGIYAQGLIALFGTIQLVVGNTGFVVFFKKSAAAGEKRNRD
jgi:hypothetical protein